MKNVVSQYIFKLENNISAAHRTTRQSIEMQMIKPKENPSHGFLLSRTKLNFLAVVGFFFYLLFPR